MTENVEHRATLDAVYLDALECACLCGEWEACKSMCVSVCVCSEMQMTVKDDVMHDSLTSDLHLCPEYEDKWLC